MTMTRRRDNQFKKLNRLANQMGEILQGLSPDDLVKVGAIIEEDLRPTTFSSADQFNFVANHNDMAYEIRVSWFYEFYDMSAFDEPDHEVSASELRRDWAKYAADPDPTVLEKGAGEFNDV